MPEYWIVDPDERTVEVWDLKSDAGGPVVHGPAGRLRWIPGEDGATLELEVEQLFGTE